MKASVSQYTFQLSLIAYNRFLEHYTSTVGQLTPVRTAEKLTQVYIGLYQFPAIVVSLSTVSRVETSIIV